MRPSDLLRPIKGVYMILCTSVNQAYIGQSINVYSRWETHRSELVKGTHHNKDLQELYERYGWQSLHFVVLEECKADALNHKEQEFIDRLEKYACINCSVTCMIREASLEALLTLNDVVFRKFSDHYTIHKSNGQIILYYPSTGRWKQKCKKKLYFSKSVTSFIKKYILELRK